LDSYSPIRDTIAANSDRYSPIASRDTIIANSDRYLPIRDTIAATSDSYLPITSTEDSEKRSLPIVTGIRL
jgi:hypothetical protein